MTLEYDVDYLGEDYINKSSGERVEIQQEVVSIEIKNNQDKQVAYEIFSGELSKVEYGSLLKLASVDAREVYFDLLRDLPKSILTELSKSSRLSVVRRMARQLIDNPP